MERLSERNDVAFSAGWVPLFELRRFHVQALACGDGGHARIGFDRKDIAPSLP